MQAGYCGSAALPAHLSLLPFPPPKFITMQAALVDPLPEVRATAAKAMGSLVKGEPSLVQSRSTSALVWIAGLCWRSGWWRVCSRHGLAGQG